MDFELKPRKPRQSPRTFIGSIPVVKSAVAPGPSAPEPAAPPVQVQIAVHAGPQLVRPEAEVIESFRQGWLEHQSVSEHDAATEKSGRKSPSTLPDYTPFSESLKASLRRRWTSLRQRRDLRPAEERSPLIVMCGLLAGLILMILVGTLLCSAL